MQIGIPTRTGNPGGRDDCMVEFSFVNFRRGEKHLNISKRL